VLDGFNMKKQILNYFLWLSFCTVGGICGAWLYDYSVNRYVGNFSGSAIMSRYDQNLPLVIRDPKKVVVEQNEKIIETINSSENFLMGLFKKSANGQYNLAKSEAQALVLTSDGWLITNFVSSDKNWHDDYVAIDKNGKLFAIDRRIDDESGLSFIHLTTAQGLTVAEFMKASAVRRGQSVLVVNWLAEARQDMVVKTDASPEALKTSDQAKKQIVVNGKYENSKSLAVLDLSGKVLGLFNREAKLMAADYFIYKTAGLLSDNKNSAPVLGVNYYNLAWQLNTAVTVQGALLTKNQQSPAVIKGLPADKAGLKEGDVIISLDELVLTKNLDLGDLLADYRPGDKVLVKYLRAGKEKTVELVLGAK